MNDRLDKIFLFRCEMSAAVDLQFVVLFFKH